MIFVILGSQKFQFNRLLKEIDELVEAGVIKETVFAQIGYSDYKPTNFNYKEFLDREGFLEMMDQCDKVITHGGTGAIIGAVKKGKKVIAVPRMAQFEEHVDNHQVQIVNQFEELGIILGCNDTEELPQKVSQIEKMNFKSYQTNTINILDSIENFIKLAYKPRKAYEITDNSHY